jgi:hypothetical protein
MGYPTLPIAFDLKNRERFQPPKGSEEVVKYIDRLFTEVYNNSDLCRSGWLKLSLRVFDDFGIDDHNEFMRYLTLLGYQVFSLPYEYEVIIRW